MEDKVKDNIQKLTEIAEGNRRFEIIRRERALDDAERMQRRSAYIAGACFLATCALVLTNPNLSFETLQNELTMLWSYDSFKQYFEDLGPATALSIASTVTFCMRSVRHGREARRLERELNDMANCEYDAVKSLGRK